MAASAAISAAAARAAEPARDDERWIAIALVVAISLTVFEGPLRHALNRVGADAAYFLRDAVMAGALFAWLLRRLPLGSVPGSATLFFALAAVHGLVGVLNLGTGVAAVYGFKMFLPALAAFLVPSAIFRCGPATLRWIVVLWIASVAGAVADRTLDGQFAWVGQSVELGGIDVQIGRDWQSGELKRVAGITRSSIHLANVLPLLTFMGLAAIHSRWLRALVCATTLLVLVWTTQKGAILGFALAIAAWAVCTRGTLAPLKAALCASLLLMLLAPTLLLQFDMPRDQGVFSFESFIERIERMWPQAWGWILEFPPLLGVGLGGIGGAQRFFAPDRFNASDNLFVYLFANFGVLALVYLGAALRIAFAARPKDGPQDAVALAALVFLFAYGIVISLIEDPSAVILLGAALGWLARPRPGAAA